MNMQCGEPRVHITHVYERPIFGEVTCPGVGERHCTMELAHEPHLFDEGEYRGLCPGTVVVDPDPEPLPQRYCEIPGGCKPGHPYALNGELYECTGPQQ